MKRFLLLGLALFVGFHSFDGSAQAEDADQVISIRSSNSNSAALNSHGVTNGSYNESRR
jgi:hypothetical protein